MRLKDFSVLFSICTKRVSNTQLVKSTILFAVHKILQLQVKSSAGLNDRAMQHPLCATNATAYVGQTAKMYCCLARLDRELSVSK